MFRYVLGDPSGNYFIQCVAARPTAVHTTYVNCDGELVIQPRGDQPLALFPGYLYLKSEFLPLAPGRSRWQESCPVPRGVIQGFCNTGSVASLEHVLCWC